MCRRLSMGHLLRKFLQPVEFDFELIDGQREHPDRLVKLVSYFFSYAIQRRYLAVEFRGDKFATLVDLFAKSLRTRLPGEREPGEKWRPVALYRPAVCSERLLQSLLALCRSAKDAAFRTGGSFVVTRCANQPQPFQLVQRI